MPWPRHATLRMRRFVPEPLEVGWAGEHEQAAASGEVDGERREGRQDQHEEPRDPHRGGCPRAGTPDARVDLMHRGVARTRDENERPHSRVIQYSVIKTVE